MTFFEQLGKRLTDTGQNVAKQTRNFADITQLNSTIAEKEKKISQIFLELGQSYYENHKDDEETEESGKIREITSLYEEIAMSREKIKQIKNAGKCAEYESDVLTEESSDRQYCPNCHALVGKEDLFCNSCGTKLKHN